MQHACVKINANSGYKWIYKSIYMRDGVRVLMNVRENKKMFWNVLRSTREQMEAAVRAVDAEVVTGK